jgi:hypothetical protein
MMFMTMFGMLLRWRGQNRGSDTGERVRRRNEGSFLGRGIGRMLIRQDDPYALAGTAGKRDEQ